MIAHNRLASLKQIAGLMSLAGVSALFSFPAWAQLNPHPSILNSSPYERAHIAQVPSGVQPSPTDAPTSTGTSPSDTSVPSNRTTPGSSPSNRSSPDSTTKPSTASPSAEVSPIELQKFAHALKRLVPIQQGVKTQIIQTLQQQNLSEKRFSEIYQARKNPQAQATSAITPQETQKFDQIAAKLQQIQKSTQSKMAQVVRGEGLDVQRFNQILVAVRQNPALRQKVREMIRS